MKNKKGFTLVELLVVVIIISIVGAIGAISAVSIKNRAADDTFNKLEKQIEDLGPEIYTHEVIVRGDSSAFYSEYKRCKKEDCDFIVPLGDESSSGTLIGSGYLKEIESPYNSSETCEGYLYVDPTSTEQVYKGYLKCGSKKSAGYRSISNTVTISDIN